MKSLRKGELNTFISPFFLLALTLFVLPVSADSTRIQKRHLSQTAFVRHPCISMLQHSQPGNIPITVLPIALSAMAAKLS